MPKSNDMSEALIDRLSLNPDRIEAMAEGLRQVAELHDPIGSVEHMQKTPNGLLIGKKDGTIRSCRYHLRIKTKRNSRCICTMF